MTVHCHGNLFAADDNGYVYQYAQGIQNPIASCYVGNRAFGVAVDGNGNVFMSAWEFDNGPAVIELAGGLSGCNVTVLMYLSTTPNQPAPSLAVDANDNLILPWENTVDVINPPYSTVTTTVGYCYATCVYLSTRRTNCCSLPIRVGIRSWLSTMTPEWSLGISVCRMVFRR